jgi:hypothetical protein
MTPTRRAAVASLLTLLFVAACDHPAIPPPDPDGKDIVEGAIVAAVESTSGGGIRLYKVQHVEDLPLPAGYEFHMIAYDPKVKSFEDASRIWQQKGTKVALNHLLVRWVSFRERDHRIVGHEPVTDEEMSWYKKSLR